MVGKFIKNNMKEEILAEGETKAYQNALKELDESWKAMIRQENKLKAEYKQKLKGLINIRGLFNWLNEVGGWLPVDIVEIKLTDKKTSGYSTYQHARIINTDDEHLYMKILCNEVKSIDYYYVWQIVGCCEDDYSGYLLFPLKNGKYFKVSYEC
jgi:hypothetical protein